MAVKSLSGGAKLEARLREIAKKVGKSAHVEIGFPAGSTYPNGTSVPLVAAVQEFGAPSVGIPPRPYFRSMIAAKSPEWGDALAAALKKHDYDVDAALGDMGEGIAGQLRQSIADTVSPPLSQVTLMLRMMRAQNPNLVVTGKTVGEAAARVAAGQRASGVSTKPLVDSGVLLQSVDYVVKDGPA